MRVEEPASFVRPDPEKPKGSWVSIVLAGCLGVMIIAGLMVVTLGYLAPVLVIVGAVFGFAAFHYLVWGWWLSKVIHREERAAPDAERIDDASFKSNGESER